MGADLCNGASSSFSPGSRFWKCVWNVKAPPKLVHFLWNIIRNVIPSKENLFAKKCSASPLCKIYSFEVESTEHILFRCDWVKQVWKKCGLSGLVSFSCIWCARNRFIFKGATIHPGKILEWACSQVFEFLLS